MTKYYKITNENVFIKILMKMKPNHVSLSSEALTWMINYQNIMNINHFNNLSEDERFGFSGLIHYDDDYYTTRNGLFIDIDTKKMIYLCDDFDDLYGENIFSILPALNKLEKFGYDYESFEFLYDFFYLNENKMLPEFRDEEWKEFLEKNIQKSGIICIEED
jgi:hypothetical protein